MYNEYVNKIYIRFVFRGRVKFPTGGYSPRPILQKIAESVKFRYRRYSPDDKREISAYFTPRYLFVSGLILCDISPVCQSEFSDG